MAEKGSSTGARTEPSQARRGLQRSTEPSRSISERRRAADPFWSGPSGIMRRLREDMDRLSGGPGFPRGWMTPFEGLETSDWAPPIDAFQRGSDFIVRADVPGMSRDDLSVEIGDEALTIRGERKFDHEEERDGVFRTERSYGSFCRVLPLPEGALTDSARASFKDGVLEVVINAPPHEVRRGRRLEIGEERSEPTGRKTP